MSKVKKGKFCNLFMLILISSSFLCVQYVNAELGSPNLKISSIVTPNEIERGRSGTLTVVVNEISGNDWAKAITVEPIPQGGCSITPENNYVYRIEKRGTATFIFTITVPEYASVGTVVGNINLKYYETGALDIGTTGPYQISTPYYFSIKKAPDIISQIQPDYYSGPSNSVNLGIIILIIGGLLIVGILFVVWWMKFPKPTNQKDNQEKITKIIDSPNLNVDNEAIKTLKLRYAKGEISKEEYNEILGHLLK